MRILLAIDDSKFSEAAVHTVSARSWPLATEVRVLHVLEAPSLLLGREIAAHDEQFEAAWKALRDRATALVANAAEVLRRSGLNVTAGLVEGDPKSQIIDVASEWNADLIVLGSHGRKGFDRFSMGSVSEAVVRYAHCSVEIVRIPAKTHPEPASSMQTRNDPR